MIDVLERMQNMIDNLLARVAELETREHYKIDANSIVTLQGGLNVGTATGAGVGDVFASGKLSVAGSYNTTGFHARTSGTKTDVTGDGTTYIIAFDTEILDPGSHYNNGTYTFTAVETGLYLLSATLVMTGFAAGHIFDIRFITSNRIYICAEELATSILANGELDRSVSALADMDAGDTAYVTIQVSGGAKTVDLYSTLSTFSGVRVM